MLRGGTLLAGSVLVGGTAAAQEGNGTGSADDGSGSSGSGVTAVACGETVTGELAGDDDTGFRSDEHYHDVYAFEATAGDSAAVTMVAAGGDAEGVETLQDEVDPAPDEEPSGEWEADPYLYLVGPDGAILAEDDDGGGALDAFIRVLRLPSDGTYYVVATSYGAEATFEYELSVGCGDVVGPVDTIECGSSVTGELAPDDATGFRSDAHAHDAYVFEGAADELVTASMGATEPPDGGDGGADGGDESADGGDESADGGDESADDDADEDDDTGGSGAADGADGAAAVPVEDTYLYLLGPDGTVVAENDDTGDGVQSALQAQLPADGEYLLVATSYAPESYFPYQLSLDCTGLPDVQSIECGETVAAAITSDDGALVTEAGDHYYDAYELEAAGGELVTVTMAADRSVAGGDTAARVDDPYLVVVGPDGSVVAEDDDGAGDLNALVRTRLLQAGTYIVVATTYEPDAFFPYELSVACEDGAVPTPDATAIACGETVFGELEPSTEPGIAGPAHFQDTYAFDGRAGTSVTVSMASTDGDSLLVLLDPDGRIVAFDDDSGGGLDALIREHELQRTGEYVIAATSYAPGETFAYALTLQCDGGSLLA